jgi:Kef-type K+ transport system membrane component KefB
MIAIIQANPFYQMTILLALATIFGAVGKLFKQPMLVGFIIVGALAGPSAIGVVKSPEHLELLAELGIALLLFVVGLKLDLHLIRSLGKVALTAGIGQIIFTTLVTYGFALLLGMNHITSLYIGVAVTFSSTIIVVKMLSDKREIDSLHGRISLGMLIVQDVVVVLAMMILSAIGVGTEADAGVLIHKVLATLGYGFMMLIFVGVFTRYFADKLLDKMADSQELLVTFSIAWAMALASIGDYLEFGKELGGLLAGISLASTPFREVIITRLNSLRDFLLLFFFIVLGAKLDLSMIGSQVGYAIIFATFVMIIKPLVIIMIMGYMGYRKRTGFLAGTTLAQLSEFSLILVAMGMQAGHISAETSGLITLVGLISIAMSVYMIAYAHEIYLWVEKPLGFFERKSGKGEQYLQREDMRESDECIRTGSYDVILFGLGNYGEAIIGQLLERKMRVLAVDFNPDVVKLWKEKNITAIYGDGCDQEFIHRLPLKGVRWVISAMPEHDDVMNIQEDPRYIMIDTLKEAGYSGKIIITTDNIDEREKFLEQGADLVLVTFCVAAEYVTDSLADLYKLK